jgi:threonine/homoserine/homoserine lactone efflux protein
MDSIQNFGTFLISCMLLNITPGSDTILILSKSIAQGKKAGVITALGIGLGIVGHTLLAAFGLSLIIAKSILLFNIVKYAGAAYIIYLGVKMILSGNITLPEENFEKKVQDLRNVFLDGFLTNILNPKVALFFIAFLPQFIDTSARGGALPFILLGLTFTTTGTIYCALLAIFAAQIFSSLRHNKSFSSVLNKTCGSVLVFLGVYVALFRKS